VTPDERHVVLLAECIKRGIAVGLDDETVEVETALLEHIDGDSFADHSAEYRNGRIDAALGFDH